MRLRFWLPALMLLALAACTGVSNKPATESIEPSEPVYEPVSGLSDKARFREALLLLESGEAQKARAELALYLESQPTSGVARDLVRQIDLAADEYFPADYREVTLESGVSLSGLAKRYLGSVFKFHALAKYNGILKPGDLTAGQDIKVPLTTAALEAFAAQDAGETIEEAPLANEVESTEVDAAAEMATEIEAEAADEVEAVVQEEEPEAPVYSAQEIDEMHRSALNAYRAQDLDRAITLWDEVLQADPGHENAALYRSQAISLKRKLNKLN